MKIVYHFFTIQIIVIIPISPKFLSALIIASFHPISDISVLNLFHIFVRCSICIFPILVFDHKYIKTAVNAKIPTIINVTGDVNIAIALLSAHKATFVKIAAVVVPAKATINNSRPTINPIIAATPSTPLIAIIAIVANLAFNDKSQKSEANRFQKSLSFGSISSSFKLSS